MNRTLLITGSTIGAALARLYSDDESVGRIIYTFHSKAPDFTFGDLGSGGLGSGDPAAEKIEPVQLDLTSEDQVAQTIKELEHLDGVINTVGILHNDLHQPEKSIRRFKPEGLALSIERNLLPTMLLAKHSTPLLKKSPAGMFAAISAKVGSIEDNRLGGWYSYRASKAALNMTLKTLAIEWQFALPNCSVAALHPGTVASPLSEPFSKNAAHVMSPEESAGHLKKILDDLSPKTSGRFWAWNGDELPW